ncbi:unnamed protein product [Amaranthus hypochondriacus]
MYPIPQMFQKHILLLLLIIVVSISCINAQDISTPITNDPNGIKCVTCNIPPPPPPTLPPCPPPPPPPILPSPPPAPPILPPSLAPPIHPPPTSPLPCPPSALPPPQPPKWINTPTVNGLYVTQYNYSAGTKTCKGITSLILIFLVGVALMEKIIFL